MKIIITLTDVIKNYFKYFMQWMQCKFELTDCMFITQFKQHIKIIPGGQIPQSCPRSPFLPRNPGTPGSPFLPSIPCGPGKPISPGGPTTGTPSPGKPLGPATYIK
jgi:hypothetical protein